MFCEFQSLIQWAIEVSCPMRPKYPNLAKHKWLSNNILQYSKELKDMFWLVKHHPNNCQLAYKYHQMKVEYKKIIAEEKSIYYNNIIHNSNNKIKSIWKIVNNKLKRNNNNNNISIIDENGKHITDQMLVAGCLGEYFSSVTEKKLNVHFGIARSTSCTVSNINPKTFFFSPVTETDVSITIAKLRNSNSKGCDDISTKVVKYISACVAEPLSHLINYCVEQGLFPNTLKTAMLVPIPKNTADLSITNFRPISVLSTISKIIEKITSDKINNFLSENNILNNAQHGFRAARSTETATCNFFEYVYKELDVGNFTSGLFFDMSIAFDCLNIQFMRDKLYNIGFRGNFLEFLISFLSKRIFIIKLKNVCSSSFDISSGVPQGSVLGPLLFTLFINDLPLVLTKGRTVIYADDVSVAVSGRTISEMLLNIVNVTSELNEWCKRNNMVLNKNKTVCIYFGVPSPNLDLLATSYNVIFSKTSKFLGVNVSEKLNWLEHVKFIRKKISKAYYAILNLKNILDISGQLNVYFALVHSILSYGIVLWGNCPNAIQIFKSQKRIIRLLCNLCNRTSCKSSFVQYKILTFPCIYIYKCLLLVKQNSVAYEKNCSTHNYSTRHANLPRVALHATAKFEKSPTYSSVKLFNKLPNTIQCLPQKQYKQQIKSLLLNKAYYSVNEYLHDNSL